jgi:hypothetical protein
MIAGPVGLLFSGLAGALMGALLGRAAGRIAGSAVGEQIAPLVLYNYAAWNAGTCCRAESVVLP